MSEQRKRSAVKSLTWALLSSCVILGLSQTVDLETSLHVLICFDVSARIVSYYLHDRVWALSRFGIKPARVYIYPSDRSKLTRERL